MNVIGRVWDQVPSEILLKVFSYLEESDLVRASSVSRRWRQMFFEPTFWKSVTFDLNHSFLSPMDVKQKLAFHVQTIGSFVRHVTIICPDSEVLVPRQMTDWVKVILDTLVKNNRTILSFQLKNLRMEQYWREQDYAKGELVDSLCHFIESQTCLQTLVLSEALLPTTFGHMVMSSLARSPSVDTLQHVDIFYLYAFYLGWNRQHGGLIRSTFKNSKKLAEIGLNYSLLKAIGVEKLAEVLQYSLLKLNLRTVTSLNNGHNLTFEEEEELDDEDDDLNHDNGYDDEAALDQLDDEDGAQDSLVVIEAKKWEQATRRCPGLRVSTELNGFEEDNPVDILVPAMPVSHLIIKGMSSRDEDAGGMPLTIHNALKHLCRSHFNNLETVAFLGDTDENQFFQPGSEASWKKVVHFLVKYPELRSIQFSWDLMSFSLLDKVKSEMWSRYGVDRDVLSIV